MHRCHPVIRCLFALASIFLLAGDRLDAQPARENRKVHILLMALTDDPSLGDCARKDLPRMGKLLTNTVPVERRGALIMLSGAQITADNILATVNRLPVQPGDAIFCYYYGHGGYDPRRAAGDPSGGHFLAAIPGGDLPRADLWRRLTARRARLTVLVTDTCSGLGQINLPPAKGFNLRSEVVTPKQNSILRTLLLSRSGMVDLSASSKNQLSWSGGALDGGWFTAAFVEVAEKQTFANVSQVSWPQFVQRVSDRTSQIFQQQRKQVLGVPGGTDPNADLLRNQPDLRPQLFDHRADPVQPAPMPPPMAPQPPPMWIQPPFPPPVIVPVNPQPASAKNGLQIPGQLHPGSPRDKQRKAPFHVHAVPLKANRTYIIDLMSGDFDAFLRIEGLSARFLAQDDDSGGNRNARIRFTPAHTGIYNVVATSFDGRMGRYLVQVRPE